jgi:hypothetical protein
LWEIAVASVIVLASVLIVVTARYPAMHDASSHIATAVIADELLSGDSFYSAHYSFEAAPIPYWATTLLMLPLLQLGSPVAAFKFLLGVYCIALPLAYLWLLRTTSPTNTPLFVVGVLTIFNVTYWFGEINTLLGFPVVLAAFALFSRLDELHSWRFLAFSFLAALAYACHIFSVICLLTAIGGLIVAHVLSLVRSTMGTPRLNRTQWLAAGWVCILVVAAMWFVLFAHSTGANWGEIVFIWNVRRFAALAILPFETISFRSVEWVAVLLVCLLALFMIPDSRGRRTTDSSFLRSRVNHTLFWPALSLLLLAYLGPAGVAEEYGFEDIGQRFPMMAMLLALGAVRIYPSQRWRVLLLTVVVMFAGIKLYDSWLVHRRHDEAAAAVYESVLATIPLHSRVLPIFDMDEPEERMDYFLHRIANYVVVRRSSYNPHIFARTGQQPLRHVDWGNYRPIQWRQVSEEEWGYYDYLVTQSEHPIPRVPGLTKHTQEIDSSGRFRLYRILRSR